MKEIIFFTILIALFFISSICTLVIGLIRKNKKLIMISVMTIIIAAGAGLFTGYKFATKAYYKVSELLKPRTGEEIYLALFNKPRHDCTKILHYQDQVIPKIDYAIWLHFKTCPDELNRILALQPFDRKKTSTKAMNSTGPSSNNKWFKPEQMGDSILIFDYKKDEYGNELTIFSNLAQTEAYCMDILD